MIARKIALALVCLGVATMWVFIATLVVALFHRELSWLPTLAFGAFLLEGIGFVVASREDDKAVQNARA